MKWIGQHIWDFISRFRSDVYLEDLADPGSDTDKFLVVDTNNKVGYRTGAEVLSDIGASSESTDLEFNGSTANGVLTYGGAAQIDVESALTFGMNGVFPELNLSHAVNPTVQLTHTGNDANDPTLSFLNKRGTSQGAGSDGDDVGSIFFRGGDGDGNETNFAQIIAEIQTAAHTDEAGKLSLGVAASDGTTTGLQQALTATGHGTSNKVDIGLGYGAASVTTIAGDLDIDGDNVTAAGALTITPGGDFSVAGGANEIDLTTTGTLDVNANSLDMDLTDSSSITLTASEDAEDLSIRVTGAHDASLILRSDGTGSDAVNINASAGGVTVNAADTYTLTSGKNKFNKIYDFHASTFENSYSDDEGTGKILRYSPGADESPNGSELFYLHTDGTWNNARATTVDLGASQLLSVGLGASAKTTGVLIEGFVRIASTEILNVPGSGAVDGLPVYVSTTSGHFDFTAPSGSGQFVRVVGYAIDDDGGDVLIYFKPSSTWVEIA